jgi:hypothetical protein
LIRQLFVHSIDKIPLLAHRQRAKMIDGVRRIVDSIGQPAARIPQQSASLRSTWTAGTPLRPEAQRSRVSLADSLRSDFLSGKFTAFIAHPVMPAMMYTTGGEVVSL